MEERLRHQSTDRRTSGSTGRGTIYD